MILNKISISGILNIGSIQMSFDDLSALIAPNNYGKSNVFRAIVFGIGFMEVPYKRKLSMMRNRSYIPINSSLENVPFSFEIEGEFTD
jgi:AAA15 family ATPase/GTPase